MDTHIEGEIQRMLAEDPDIAELGITVVCEHGTIALLGCVNSAERRDHIGATVDAAFPDHSVRNEITVVGAEAPSEAAS